MLYNASVFINHNKDLCKTRQKVFMRECRRYVDGNKVDSSPVVLFDEHHCSAHFRCQADAKEHSYSLKSSR